MSNVFETRSDAFARAVQPNVRAESVDHAVSVLAQAPEARVLAGGQSLAPMLALRLARPEVLVDVNRLPLTGIAADSGSDSGDGGGEVHLGALTRHRFLALDPVVAREAPLLAAAARHVGDAAIRNRGTLGGSLAHADPAAELPAALVASGGRVILTSQRGTRELAAADLFEGFFVTGLAPDELLTGVVVPRTGEGTGVAFEEWAPRAADFPWAGIAVTLQIDTHGTCTAVGAAACGVASVPVDLAPSLTAAGVLGAVLDDDALWPSIATHVEAACAGDDDRAELAGLLAARAVRRAWMGAMRMAAAA